MPATCRNPLQRHCGRNRVAAQPFVSSNARRDGIAIAVCPRIGPPRELAAYPRAVSPQSTKRGGRMRRERNGVAVTPVLITGGAGFLGRHLANALDRAGYRVTVLDDLSCVNSTFDCAPLESERIDKIRGSVFDRALVAN